MSPRAWIAFAAVSTLWGIPYLFIKVAGSGEELLGAGAILLVAVALGVAVLGERPGAGAVAGLLLIIAGSWLSTDGRLPPGLAGIATRRRERRRAAAQSPRSPAIHRSKPAGVSRT